MKAKRKFKDYALKHAKIRKEKKVKGFTLVELIVVIAIIGVLAAILIPTMMGRVKDARLQTANDAAAKIAEQAAIIAADMEAAGTTLEFNETTYGATLTFTEDLTNPTSGSEAEKFKNSLKAALPDVGKEGAHFAIKFGSTGSVDAVVYGKHGDKYVGGYPNKAVETVTGGVKETGDTSGMTIQDLLEACTSSPLRAPFTKSST